MNKADYFIRRKGEERGPTTAARIRELAAAGKLSKDDVIRRGEDGEWFRAGDITGLFDGAGGVDATGELIQDPLVRLSEKTGGMIVKAAGAIGKTATHLGGSIKGTLARQSELAAMPTAIRASEPASVPTVRIPANETPILIERQLIADETALCPFCSETIKKSAKKCKHCGEILDVVLRDSHRIAQVHAAAAVAPQAPVIHISNVNTANANNYGGRRGPAWSPFAAALLSFLIPGLGQMYKGQILNGIAWFFAVAVGYVLFVVPGLVLHLCCVLGAAMGDPYR